MLTRIQRCGNVFSSTRCINYYKNGSVVGFFGIQPAAHDARFGRPYHGGNLCLGGFAHTLDAAEMAEQSRVRGLAYSFYGRKFAGNLAVAASVAVVGDAEAVGFVAQGLDYAQRFAAFVPL